MQTVHTIAELRKVVGDWRQSGARVGFVPTMGNLHRGHLALIDHARAHASRVVASIYVNPTQFGPNEDYVRYPRTLAADQASLAASGCDLLYAPHDAQMYPDIASRELRIDVGPLSHDLCGAHRPGHFAGVATVVAKLFNQVGPDLAVFGTKDYQQLAVIRKLVRALDLPIQIDGVETIRDDDGLALSSRNQYLDPEQRRRACGIHATLKALAGRLQVAGGAAEGLADDGVAKLSELGFSVDYVALRDADNLNEINNLTRNAVILAAAWLGPTRLIDNLVVALKPQPVA